MSLIRTPYLVFALLFLLIACTETPQEATTARPAVDTAAPVEQAPTMRPVEKGQPTGLSQPAFLRANMPDQAMAYVRLPSLFGMTDVELGIYDPAHQSAAYLQAIQAIRQGMIDNLLGELNDEPGLQLLAEVLVEDMRSPLELVLLPPPSPEVPMPSLLASVELNLKKAEDINSTISRLVLANPGVKIIRAVEADGMGAISVNGLPAQVYVDADTKRVFLLSGVLEPADYLKQLVSALKPTAAHPMQGLESKVDTSGQGLFVWLAPKSIVETAQAMGQPWGIMLAAAGLSEAEGISLGVGVADGKQRMRLDIQMPHVGMRQFLPAVQHDFSFQGAGEIGSVMTLSIPGAEDINKIEQLMFSMSPTESVEKYQAGKRQMEEKLGISLNDLLSVFGPEGIIMFDEAGQYMALKLKDRDLFEKLMKQLETVLGIKRDQRTLMGTVYHHTSIPGLMDESVEEALQTKGGSKLHPLLKRLFNLPSHVYWVEEGDYLVSAVVPQVLMDRHYIRGRTPVSDWLKKTQKVDPSNAWMLASVELQGVPRFIYSMELQGLLALADLAGAELDIYSLPSAREFGLPDASAYTAQLDSSDQLLSLELSFEHNPAEILMGGNGVAGIAVVGILAAVAIPAYQDYTVRARVTEGLSLSSQYRQAIMGYYQKYEALPAQAEVEAFIGEPESEAISAIEYDAETGRLTVVYSIPVLGDQNRLFLTPGLKDGQVIWTCSADIQSKYLPESCRQ